MDDPALGATAELHYAFGLEIEMTSDGAVRSFYKDGFNTGARAIVRHYPALDVTLAVVQSGDGAWKPVALLDEAVTSA